MIHDRVVIDLPLNLVDGSNVVLVVVVDAKARGNRKSMQEVGSCGVGYRCFICRIQPRDDGLGRVGSDATLRVRNRLHRAEGDKQRAGKGRARQQELSHYGFLQFGKTELTSKIPYGEEPRAGKNLCKEST